MTTCWDPEKNRRNQARPPVGHGIRFEDAKDVFQDPLLLVEYDDRDYGEDRGKAIGRIRMTIFVVVYTERHCGEWLISARKAEPDEERRYFSGEAW